MVCLHCICFLLAGLLLSSADHALAVVIGKDDRQMNKINPCADRHPVVAKIFVRDFESGDYHEGGNATLAALPGWKDDLFFIGAAHVFVKDGALKGRVNEMRASLHVAKDGACKYVSWKIRRLHLGSTSPRKTWKNTRDDLALFRVDRKVIKHNALKAAIINGSVPEELRMRSFHGYDSVSDVNCLSHERPDTTRYTFGEFVFHDCDTTKGAFGAALYSRTQDQVLLHAVHVDGEGPKISEGFGDSHNVAIPLDKDAVRIIKEMRRGLRRAPTTR